MTDIMTKKYNEALDFIKSMNPNITFGVVFTIADGRKHRLWIGSEAKPAFRLSLKNQYKPKIINESTETKD